MVNNHLKVFSLFYPHVDTHTHAGERLVRKWEKRKTVNMMIDDTRKAGNTDTNGRWKERRERGGERANTSPDIHDTSA